MNRSVMHSRSGKVSGWVRHFASVVLIVMYGLPIPCGAQTAGDVFDVFIDAHVRDNQGTNAPPEEAKGPPKPPCVVWLSQAPSREMHDFNVVEASAEVNWSDVAGCTLTAPPLSVESQGSEIWSKGLSWKWYLRATTENVTHDQIVPLVVTLTLKDGRICSTGTSIKAWSIKPASLSISGPAKVQLHNLYEFTACMEGEGIDPPVTFVTGVDGFTAYSGRCEVGFIYAKYAGMMTINVTARSANNYVASAAKDVFVYEKSPIGVTLECDAAEFVDRPVTCNVIAQTAPPEPGEPEDIYDYSLDWSDGKSGISGITSTSYSFVHNYSRRGLYNLTATVRNSKGGSGIAFSTVAIECPADGVECGGKCYPAGYTCCAGDLACSPTESFCCAGGCWPAEFTQCCNNLTACPADYECCGNGCCSPRGYCVRPGFCCLKGNVPCPDGKTCCTSVSLCHPDVNLCCDPGYEPIPGSGGLCRPTTARGMAVPAAASAKGEAFMMKNRSTPVIFPETDFTNVYPFVK